MDKPLLDKRIAITRAAGQADELAERLAELGAVVVRAPTIAIAPPLDSNQLDAALRQLRHYAWAVFTSINAVAAVADRIGELGILWPDTLQIAAVGAATARALENQRLVPVLVPQQHTAEGLIEAMEGVAGLQVFLPQADLARETLATGLRERGAIVDAVVAYRTIAGPGASVLAPLLAEQHLDAIVFTSPSTIDYLLQGLEGQGLTADQSAGLLSRLSIICIGPITAKAALARGLLVAAEAAQQSTEGLIQALTIVFAAT